MYGNAFLSCRELTANSLEGPVEMGFDRVDGHLKRVRDVLQVHFFRKLHQENSTLVRRKCFKDKGEPGYLLPGDQLGFGCAAFCLDERSNIADVDRGGLGALPEFELFGALVIADEVDGDGGKKGVDRGLSAKAGASVVGLEQAILGDGLGEVWVSCREGDEAKNTGPVGLDESVDVVKLVAWPDFVAGVDGDGEALGVFAGRGLTWNDGKTRLAGRSVKA